ncbi:MAG: hypothetical protein UV78_C0021G0019 [Parcubacteria group bacterium GW2011_GWA2_43_17]|nr:MAG: hypothetical protein UV78_C0021G0019 [Parcubacteria group bacterium GW2011_GWA2_43_17]OGY94827.1 MAG: hypothetical protein A2260_02630 [Candidatus Komeilibacteria bacterium RIFOXYA2_FULL_45_9]
MKSQNKKLYLWDAGNTLFPEKWQHPQLKTYQDFLLSKFPDGRYNKLDDERADEEAYEKEYFKVWANDGFKELLEWTKNNFVVTTGTVKQTSLRRAIILFYEGFDIMKYIKGVISTFNYHDDPTENGKNEAFWLKWLKEKYHEGYREIVYADDKVQSVKNFYGAAGELNLSDLHVRGYHLKNDDSGINKVENYLVAGSLLDVLKNEKSL